MKRGRSRLLRLTIIVFMLVLVCSGTAWAYTTYNSHVLNGGVGNYGSNPRYYYITSGATDHANDITAAMSDWIYTTSRLGITTPIYWQRTTVQSSSVMDIYHGYYYDPGTGIVAITEHILSGQIVNPYNTNWNWGKIKLNAPLFDNLSDYNEKGTVAHEMGHLMGLGHTSFTDQIMCTLGAGRTVNSCQDNDCYGINYLY